MCPDLECRCCGHVKPQAAFPHYRRVCNRCLSLQRQVRRAAQTESKSRRKFELLRDVRAGRKYPLEQGVLTGLADQFGGAAGIAATFKDVVDRAIAAGRHDVASNGMCAILKTFIEAQWQTT